LEVREEEVMVDSMAAVGGLVEVEVNVSADFLALIQKFTLSFFHP
jgi:hypothetical protein